MDKKSLEQALRRSALFSDTDEANFKRILAASSEHHLARNEFVFMEGDDADGLYLVLSGRVRLFKTSMQGKEHVLHFAEAGEGFAEAALFSDGGYPASAQAVRESRVVRVPRDTFFSLLDSDTRFRNSVFRSMAKWLRRFADIIQSLTFRDVESRLASYILAQCGENPDPCGDGARFDLGIEKSMLASYLGTIPETLSRAFRKMQDNGLLEVERSQITVLDWNGLKKLVGN